MRKLFAVLLLLVLAAPLADAQWRAPERRFRKTTHMVGNGGDVAIDTIFIEHARAMRVVVRTARQTACSTFTIRYSHNDTGFTADPNVNTIDSISNTICNSAGGRLGWATVHALDGTGVAVGYMPFRYALLLLRREFGVAAGDTNLTSLDTAYVQTTLYY